MNKLPKDKRDKILMILGAALLFGLVYWYFVITSQGKALEKERQAIAEVTDKIAKAETFKKRGPYVKNDLAELGKKLDEVEGQMIPALELSSQVWLFTRIDELRQKYDLQISGFPRNAATDRKALSLPRFAYAAAVYPGVKLDGYFHDIGKFLQDFENTYPYISLQNVVLTPLATPSVALGTATDKPAAPINESMKEKLNLSMDVVVLYRPTGPT
ncbi:MAG: hypothetical protein AB1813_16290 [Verrucomicrobiota bacterium]|jgi:Tfp pilus assembly protein PilO